MSGRCGFIEIRILRMNRSIIMLNEHIARAILAERTANPRRWTPPARDRTGSLWHRLRRHESQFARIGPAKCFAGLGDFSQHNFRASGAKAAERFNRF